MKANDSLPLPESTIEVQRKKRSVIGSLFRHFGLVLFLSSLGVYLLTLNGLWATDHSSAFVEFQYSLYTNHSLVLGKVGIFQPHSVDVFSYNGNYFMANAPGTAFLTLPFAIIAFILVGHFSVFGDVLLLTEFPIALANSFAVYFVYRIGSFYFRKEISVFLAFSYAFSTISWPFATFFFQSDLSALLDLISCYLAIKIGRETSVSIRLIVLCGLAVTISSTVDYVNAILIPILAIYIFLTGRGRTNIVRALASFIASSSLTFLFLGMYNYASFGNPFLSSEQLYLKSPNFFGNFTFPVHLGVILNLFSPMRGVLLFSPILILGFWGTWKMMRKPTVDREAILFLALFLGIFLPYSAWYDPTAGEAFGPRFIISAIPFLLIPAGFVISEVRGKYGYSLAYLLYTAGVLINGMAAMVSVLAPPTKEWMISPFLTIVVPHVISGSLDSWWKGYMGDYWLVVFSFVVLFALLIPLVSGYFIERQSRKEEMKHCLVGPDKISDR